VTVLFIDPALDGVTSMSNVHLPIFTGDGIYTQCSQAQVIILVIRKLMIWVFS
jgi:hypothetical protein